MECELAALKRTRRQQTTLRQKQNTRQD